MTTKYFVAWHPERGIKALSVSRGGCEERLTEIDRNEFFSFERYIATHEAELAAANNDGWRIRECEIVFADEPREGLVAGALRRQGMDPNTCTKNNTEVSVLCGQRFESDLEPKPEFGKWIKCSEDLPKVQGEYLVYSTDDPTISCGLFPYLGKACFAVTSQRLGQSTNGPSIKTGFYIESIYTANVTHWMPLPPSPEEEK